MIVSLWFGIKSILLFKNPFSKKPEDLKPEEIQRNLEEWFKSPGLIPLIFSSFLMICAIVLFITAIKQGARVDFIKKNKIVGFIQNKELHTALTVIGL